MEAYKDIYDLIRPWDKAGNLASLSLSFFFSLVLVLIVCFRKKSFDSSVERQDLRSICNFGIAKTNFSVIQIIKKILIERKREKSIKINCISRRKKDKILNYWLPVGFLSRAPCCSRSWEHFAGGRRISIRMHSRGIEPWKSLAASVMQENFRPFCS